MSREWVPGEVAMVMFAGVGGDPETAVGICYHGGPVSRGSTTGVAKWRLGDGTDIWSSAIEARPLVVIDPEDRREIQRLLVGFCRAAEITVPTIRGTDAMQTALRGFANPTPPKPAEPQGLGAVVEDADGQQWVAIGDATDPVCGPNRWREALGTATGQIRTYRAVAAVRVLSPGVEVES